MFSLWPTGKYQELSQEKGEAASGDDEYMRRALPAEPDYIPYTVPATILLLIFFITSIPLCFLHLQHGGPRWETCGDNPTTARERGCSFDVMSFIWQLPNCYDGTIVEEFAAWEPWEFATDIDGNETVSLEEARQGNLDLWTSWRFHVVHCTFAWRQMHRAYESGWIDGHLRNWNHTKHCQKMMLMDCKDEGRYCGLGDDMRYYTSAAVQYPTCEKVSASKPKGMGGINEEMEVSAYKTSDYQD